MTTQGRQARISFFNAAKFMMHAWPDRLRGKTRFGAWLLRLFAPTDGGFITGAYGLTYEIPSFREPIALGLFNSGQYEPDTVDAVVSNLPKNGIFLDIGANIGTVSLPVAAQRSDASVIAVEADGRICQMLRSNVERNSLSNITVYEALVGDCETEEVAFYCAPKDKFGMGSIGPQFSADAIKMRQRIIPDILNDYGISTVDVIKIDIEGAEHKALKGAREILSSVTAPVIIFEFLDWAESRILGQNAGDAQRLLIELGYELESLGENGGPMRAPMVSGGAMLIARKPLKHICD